jgi:serine protease Do
VTTNRLLTILTCCAFALAACSRPPPKPPGDPFVAAFARLRPSVVLFTMRVPSDDPKKKGRFDDAYGSGIIVASGAHGSQILTVEHVIDGASHLHVTLDDKRTVPAHVVAADTRSDLALVAIVTPNRPVANLGTSENLAPGTAIGVAGYPIPDAFEDEKLGTETSVFSGRVSSHRNDALELDLPVIPGESGGPVFDARSGAVVALAESRFDDEKAIGFGIPIEDAERFLHDKLHTVAKRTP